MMGLPRELPVLSPAEVARHNTAKSLWLSVQNKVYDVSQFMFDHPGGEELLLQFGGQDVTSVMKDPTEHTHSESAYEMLEDYCVGILGTTTDTETSKMTTDSLSPTPPASSATQSHLGRKEAFIDTSKPMLMQVFMNNYSKEKYLEQVHIPRHVHDSAPIFGTAALEALTKTP
ncbi:fatty acid alpha-hydroxylase, partial [Thoreauomyces humboldtii]